jgi:CDGSH-type Zn-finger protein
MSVPTIAQKGPYPVPVEAGKSYYWCSCGLSKSQPFCDGSHAGTGPLRSSLRPQRPRLFTSVAARAARAAFSAMEATLLSKEALSFAA